MKKRFVRLILLITTLLISQISSAYTSMDTQPNCDMNMSSKMVMEQNLVDENTDEKIDEQVSEQTDDMPDCCDKSGNMNVSSNTNVSMSCCDDNCHCSGLTGTCIALFSQTSSEQSYVSEALITLVVFPPTTPNLTQPQRPPIS